MLFSRSWALAAALSASLCSAPVALAAGKKKAPRKEAEKEDEPEEEKPEITKNSVITDALSTKLGLEYNLTMRRADYGLEKTEGVKPKAGTDVALKSMKLKLAGNFTPKAEYKVSIDAAVPNDPIEYAKATAWLAKSFGVSAGKEAINQGGFEQKNAGYDTVILSPYNTNQTPLDISQGVLELNLKVAGMITLQLTQDRLSVPITTSTAEDSRAAQPAITLEWLGDVKVVHPLIQLGSYDAGRSKYFDVGLGVTTGAFRAFADVLYDMRSAKYPLLASTTGEKTKLDTTHRLIALDLALELKKVHELFLRGSTYEVDQPADSTTGLEDRAYNTSTGGIVLDDDAVTVALGFRLGLIEKHFRPYLAVTDQVARFKVPSSPDKTETRSELGVQVGVTGEM